MQPVRRLPLVEITRQNPRMDRTDAGRGRVAASLAIVTGVLALAGIGLSLLQPNQDGRPAAILSSVAAAAAFGPIGALVVRRRGNPVGWVLLAIGAGLAVTGFTIEYGVVAATRAAVLPAWEWVVLLGLVAFLLTAGAVALLLLLFPTGTLPGPGWRVVLWGGLAGVVGATVLEVLDPVRVTLTESSAVSFQNPAGVESLRMPISTVLPIFAIMAVAAGLASIASPVVRFRRGSTDDRERLKWLAYVAVSAVLFLFLGEAASVAAGCEETCGNSVWYVFSAGVSLGLPTAVGIAILRHGLYDIAVVIRKTVVAATLVVFFVLVYLLVVGGVGALVQNISNTALSFAAAALVAVLSQPMLARARRFADVVVYGKRATPYEVLAEFSGVMGETRPNDVVLDEMARVVGEGAGAREAAVWLRLDRSLHLAAAWPVRPVEPTPVRLVGTELPSLPAEVTVPVRHDQELLGALALSMPTSHPAGQAIRRLLADLAGQAGLVLRNVQLIEELRASRRRLVSAQDEERRRLERNLHDGAQQQLIALKLRLRLTEEIVGEGPQLLRRTLAELADAAQSALDDLRDLARGIYPPLLADRGLTAAIEAQATRSPVEVRVEAEAIPRYRAEIEAAVYFCSLEALQNVAKYANATSATVHLSVEDGALVFAVSDDGDGFDTAHVGLGTGLQGMADRVAALGGSLTVRSEPGGGTTITGQLPVGGVPDATVDVPAALGTDHAATTRSPPLRHEGTGAARPA
jgi:signal transduction histidine kinase